MIIETIVRICHRTSGIRLAQGYPYCDYLNRQNYYRQEGYGWKTEGNEVKPVSQSFRRGEVVDLFCKPTRQLWLISGSDVGSIPRFRYEAALLIIVYSSKNARGLVRASIKEALHSFSCRTQTLSSASSGQEPFLATGSASIALLAREYDLALLRRRQDSNFRMTELKSFLLDRLSSLSSQGESFSKACCY